MVPFVETRMRCTLPPGTFSIFRVSDNHQPLYHVYYGWKTLSRNDRVDNMTSSLKETEIFPSLKDTHRSGKIWHPHKLSVQHLPAVSNNVSWPLRWYHSVTGPGKQPSRLAPAAANMAFFVGSKLIVSRR